MAENIINSGINYLMDKSGLQQHFDENEMLRSAANRGQISNELYNKMGGFNFRENAPYAGTIGTALGSTGYNLIQSIRDGQPILDGVGDIVRNTMGAATGLTKEERDIYDNILGKREPTLTDSLVNIPSNLKNMIGDAIFTKAYAPEPTERERQSIEMGVMNPELTRKFDKSPAPLGMMDRLKGGLGSIRGKVGDFITGGGILGNIFSGFGKRGDESTRGIAGLNVNDVFNIDSFGSDEDPTKDPYGINIVSAKGDYNSYVKNKARELAKMQFKTKTGKQRQDFYKQAADEIRAKEAAELKAALQRAQAEINRMGYQDYGSGGADTFDTSNIDDAGNYSDSLDPGQTE